MKNFFDGLYLNGPSWVSDNVIIWDQYVLQLKLTRFNAPQLTLLDNSASREDTNFVLEVSRKLTERFLGNWNEDCKKEITMPITNNLLNRMRWNLFSLQKIWY